MSFKFDIFTIELAKESKIFLLQVTSEVSCGRILSHEIVNNAGRVSCEIFSARCFSRVFPPYYRRQKSHQLIKFLILIIKQFT